MTLLLALAIRSSIMLAAGLLLTASLAKRSAALRHRVLAVSLLAGVAVIPVSLALPEWNITLPTRLLDDSTGSPAVLETLEETSQQRSETAPGFSLTETPGRNQEGVGDRWSALAFVLLWAAGAVGVAGTLVAGLLRVRRAARRASRVDDPQWLGILEAVSKRYGLTREVVLSRSGAADLLGTWGILRPQVLLPRGSDRWTLDRVHVVLCHELAHIRRHDWPMQIGAEVVRALLWFNPLVWIACRRLRRESEQACDDEVLGVGVGGREYAAQLLDLARQCRSCSTWASAMPMAHSSTLEGRITAMLNPLLDRRTPSGRTLALLAVVLLAVMLPVAALRATQSGPAPLSGTVYDVTGGVIPGAQVALVDATDGKWTATSNARGRFELPPVGPGKFLLEVTLPGFRALRQEFELREARDWDRAVTLQVGSLSESVTISASRATLPTQVKSTSGGAQPIRVGGNIRVPKKEVHVAPVYPESMRAAGLSGVVPLEAVIGADGTVSSVRVLSAQVHPDFAIAAVDAVRQWRFTPTLLNRVPVEVMMTVTLRFELAN